MSNIPHEPDWDEVHREADSSMAAVVWAVAALLVGGGIILLAIL